MNRPAAVAIIPLPEATAGWLREACDLVVLPPDTPRAEVVAALAEAEGLLCPAPYLVDTALLDAAPRLRVVANFGVGFNNVDLDELDRRGIVCCNTPGVLSDAVADLTMALILAASRHVVAGANYVASGGWAAGGAPPPLGFDVGGKTLGLVGFGRIGRATAHRARAFGMRVMYCDVADHPGADWDYCTQCDIGPLLAEADIVSIHVNLTPATHHLIGEAEFAQMKANAWIVNTSRGPVIDQAALVAALREGRIAGAALDVLETEPPAADEALLALPNVIVLPHIGSATVETRAAMLHLAVRNLRAVLAGERPPECVNPQSLERALGRR